MAIEFRCTQCQKLLRTQDETAGKQAKCPHCGGMVQIPSATGDSLGGPLPSSGNPFESGAGGLPGSSPGGFPSGGVPGGLPPAGGYGGPPAGAAPPGSFNPYQSPVYGGGGGMPFQSTGGPRSGPPWERDGASFGSYWETVKLCFSSPADFFRDMRREGGIGAPLVFGMIGGSLGLVVALLCNFGLQVMLAGIAPAGGGGGGNQMGIMLGGGVIGLVLGLVCGLIGLVISMLITSGLFHLLLSLVGGANFPFETTFRVVAYTMGATYLLQLIPICGGLIALVVMIVFTIIGLANAHETSGGKAAAAVLLTYLVCCVAVVLVYFLFAAAIIAAIGAGGAGGGGFNP